MADSKLPTTHGRPPGDLARTSSWPPSLISLEATMIGDWHGAEIPEPISATDLSWISSRLAEIETALAGPKDKADLVPVLTMMFASYPATPPDETTAKARIGGYVIALMDRPLWAVQSAVARWIRGEVSGVEKREFAFAPAAARLRLLANEAMEPLLKEKARLMLLRKAKVVRLPTAEERAATIERLRKAGVLTT